MNSLINSDSALTMSSLEIAELTGKRHDHVMTDIRKMLEVMDLNAPEFLGTAFYEVNNAKREREIFNLPKRETLILISGYNIAMRAKIIDRWQELEVKHLPRFQVPDTLAGALRLAAEQAEAIEQQNKLISQQKPAVEFVEKYVETKTNKTISEVAKLLKVPQQQFFAFLEAKGIIFYRSNTWLPTSKYEKYFEVKTNITKTKMSYLQARFTPDGVVWISSKWQKQNGK